MHLYISAVTIHYHWRMYDERNRLLAQSEYASNPEGVALQVRPLLDAFEGSHTVHFHYDTIKAAKEVEWSWVVKKKCVERSFRQRTK